MLARMQIGDVATGYARLYGPLAVVCLVISFLPILPEDEYGTLYEMAGRTGGGPAVLGILLMLSLVVSLGYAALRPRYTPGVPLTITVLAAVIVLMLLTKPGTASPTPSLTPEGDAALAVAFVTTALGIAHLLQLRQAAQRRTRS